MADAWAHERLSWIYEMNAMRTWMRYCRASHRRWTPFACDCEHACICWHAWNGNAAGWDMKTAPTYSCLTPMDTAGLFRYWPSLTFMGIVSRLMVTSSFIGRFPYSFLMNCSSLMISSIFAFTSLIIVPFQLYALYAYAFIRNMNPCRYGMRNPLYECK